LVAVDSGELGKFRVLDRGTGEFHYLGGLQGFGRWFGHVITFFDGGFTQV
jgi:hypothetical protein